MSEETKAPTLDERIEQARQQVIEFSSKENDLEADLETVRSLKNQAVGRINVLNELKGFETPNGDGATE